MRMLKTTPRNAQAIEPMNWETQLNDARRTIQKLEKQLEAARSQRTEILKLKREVAELQTENSGLREVIRSEKKIPPWDLAKVIRQRNSLAQVTARNTRLRFQLRALTRLGRGLTPGEFRAALEAELDGRPEADRKMLEGRIGKPADES